MRIPKRISARSDRVWRRVMREGHVVEEVARELGMRPARLERLLMAVARRRALALQS